MKLAADEILFSNFPNGNIYLFNFVYEVKKESNAPNVEK